jgi:cytochrome c553
MNINGVNTLIIALPFLQVGDLKAIWGLCGLTMSATNKKPCSRCHTSNSNFINLHGQPELMGLPRSTTYLLNKLNNFNEGQYGKIIPRQTRDELKAEGYTSLSAMLKWPNFRIENTMVDIYHQLYLGLFLPFLRVTLSVIYPTDDDIGTLCLKWKRYVKLNKLELHTSFKSIKNLSNFNSDSRKKFIECLPLLLLSDLDLTNESENNIASSSEEEEEEEDADAELSVRTAFEGIRLFASISNLLSIFSYSSIEINLLRRDIHAFNVFCKKYASHLFNGVNLHNLCHSIEQIITTSSPRGYGCLSFERYLRGLKRLMQNTNNKNICKTVFERNFAQVIFDTIDLASDKKTSRDFGVSTW